MISLPLPPKATKKGKNQAIFEIQGLYPGYGVTVGNALRRVLLSSLEGVAVTEMKIQGVPHEFSTIPGVLEDVMMILLRVKNLRFKISDGQIHKVQLNVKGEREVTGKDITLPVQVELANPELHLCTITDKKTEFSMEITLEKGIGYEPKDQRKGKKAEIGAIALDAIFTPIKNVNFQVENMRVGDRTDFDKLSIEIETDGTLTPQDAFYQAADLLIRHFSVIHSAASVEAKPDQQEEAEVSEVESSEGKEAAPAKKAKAKPKKSKK
jgi:DNA-directed RNA polymerase subunit alpha